MMKRSGSIPIEFKLLVVLRILARGNDFDTINELSMIPLSICHKIFCDFVFNFAPKFLQLHVCMPTGSELRDVMNTYKAMGFNGAIGSIDCTHVLLLNKCPNEYANICTGKEKKPTLTFQFVVSHDRQVLMMVSDAFFGSNNDKMIVKNVKETLEMINGKYEIVTYALYDEHGQPIYCRGAYLIAYAGFLQIACIVDPTRDSWDFATVRWCEFLKSIRKDIECFFSILKGRFRYLQNHVNNHSFQVIDAALKTCCILHNIILEYDFHCHRDDVVGR